MGIGLRRGTVAVEQHSPEWETAAKQTIELLKKILRDNAADIQHVGSTAVRGICAKPIIDIAVGVSDFNDILDMNNVLESNGFIFRGQDIPGQYLYVRGGSDFRTHHIHVVRYGSDAWNNYVNMRDYLNCHKEDARAYSELKQSLATQYPDDRETYTAMKSDMINGILNKAKIWRNSASGTKTDDNISAMIENMIRWAENKLGETGYAGWCLSFIEDALEISNNIEIFGGGCAKESAALYSDAMRRDPPERGAFVFYDCICVSEDGPVNWGHCGVSLGDGRVIHAWDKVRIDNYTNIEQMTAMSGDCPRYIGWVPLERVLSQKPDGGTDPDRV